jgi:hypothetical protein
MARKHDIILLATAIFQYSKIEYITINEPTNINNIDTKIFNVVQDLKQLIVVLSVY